MRAHYVLFMVFVQCAQAPAPASSPAVPARPHVVEYDASARVVGCPKTGTTLALAGPWSREEAGLSLILRRTDCRATLVVRAGRLSERAADFERDWVSARVPLSEGEHTEMRAHAAELGVAHTQSEGTVFRYELDQLANLTCSFLVVGDAACVGAPLAGLARAPSILRTPPAAPKQKPTRNMGPNGDSRMHDLGGRF